jgi:hypothetical protein
MQGGGHPAACLPARLAHRLHERGVQRPGDGRVRAAGDAALQGRLCAELPPVHDSTPCIPPAHPLSIARKGTRGSGLLACAAAACCSQISVGSCRVGGGNLQKGLLPTGPSGPLRHTSTPAAPPFMCAWALQLSSSCLCRRSCGQLPPGPKFWDVFSSVTDPSGNGAAQLFEQAVAQQQNFDMHVRASGTNQLLQVGREVWKGRISTVVGCRVSSSGCGLRLPARLSCTCMRSTHGRQVAVAHQKPVAGGKDGRCSQCCIVRVAALHACELQRQLPRAAGCCRRRCARIARQLLQTTQRTRPAAAALLLSLTPAPATPCQPSQIQLRCATNTPISSVMPVIAVPAFLESNLNGPNYYFATINVVHRHGSGTARRWGTSCRRRTRVHALEWPEVVPQGDAAVRLVPFFGCAASRRSTPPCNPTPQVARQQPRVQQRHRGEAHLHEQLRPHAAGAAQRPAAGRADRAAGGQGRLWARLPRPVERLSGVGASRCLCCAAAWPLPAWHAG